MSAVMRGKTGGVQNQTSVTMAPQVKRPPRAFITRASSFRRGQRVTTVLASRLDPAVLADGGPAAVLALRLAAAVLAEGGPAAVLALRLDPAVLADGGPAAVLALWFKAAVLADGGPATVFAL